MRDGLRTMTLDLAGQPYTLDTYDTHRCDRRGQTIIGYEFWEPDGVEPLFEGENFAGSPLHADDSDETVWSLLNFLSLRPGDTDADYFDGYTRAQREWTTSTECEELSMLVSERLV